MVQCHFTIEASRSPFTRYLPPFHAKFPIIPFVFPTPLIHTSHPLSLFQPFLCSGIIKKGTRGIFFGMHINTVVQRRPLFFLYISRYISLDHKGWISFRITRNYLCFFPWLTLSTILSHFVPLYAYSAIFFLFQFGFLNKQYNCCPSIRRPPFLYHFPRALDTLFKPAPATNCAQ